MTVDKFNFSIQVGFGQEIARVPSEVSDTPQEVLV
eukprot:CAMPEP_0115003458 /NCGR_PEP_ID=MMETSP0216-20121206/18624_1 /TAXON_ID=223996 /ORGANISM="Protocruzia adherens, Strain Boccale" /LENGTH=34 /DNA_ID= /DNA_START= /DNA_END= /DNA_ORIENTATION=